MKKVKISEIVDVFNGTTPPTKNKDYYNGNIIWFTPKDFSVQKNKYYFQSERNITELALKNTSLNIIPKNSLLMTSRAPIGLLGINKVPCTTNQGFKSMVKKQNAEISIEYLYYYFLNFQKELQNLGGGTTFKEISKGVLEQLEITIDSYDNQLSIASLLSKYDRKIIINEKIIEKLNSYINLLYNYWFTQFDFPDENGRPYKSSGGKMIWNNKLKREIPEGWEVQTLLKNDISEIVGGGVKPYEGTKEYLATADIDENGALEGELLTYDERPNRANMSPVKNSIWIAKMAESSKRLFFTDESKLIDKYIISTGMFGFISKKEHYEYLMMYLFSDHFEKLKDRFAQGATQRAINQANLSLFPIVIPEENILKQFHNLTKDMVRKIELLKEENIELKKQRDFLLPLLMNGQVTIK